MTIVHTAKATIAINSFIEKMSTVSYYPNIIIQYF